MYYMYIILHVEGRVGVIDDLLMRFMFIYM